MSERADVLNSVLLIGGPDAGKSNFLFRLWHSVDAGQGVLVKDGLPEELEYLRNGIESLLKGKFAGRTSKEVLERIAIPVKAAADAALSGMLTVPDVPGERILRVYQSRQWDDLWEQRIVEGCGCLLFVRAGSDEIVRPLDYAECLRLYGAALPSTGLTGQSNGLEARHVERAPITGAARQEPPTDVVLTDWLQFLRRAFTDKVGGHYRPKVGIVIAAWDNVPQDQLDRPPSEYLQSNFPLLWQFTESNPELFDFQTFGVSIFGGDLKNDTDFRESFSKGRPNDFGYVMHTLRGKLEKDHDITIPVAWGLGWLRSATAPEARL